MGLKIFLYLAAILGVLSVVNGLKCYSCTAGPHPGCANDFESLEEVCEETQTKCAEVQADYSKEPGKLFVSRLCTDENYCKHAYKNNREYDNVKCSVCDGDLCNNNKY